MGEKAADKALQAGALPAAAWCMILGKWASPSVSMQSQPESRSTDLPCNQRLLIAHTNESRPLQGCRST